MRVYRIVDVDPREVAAYDLLQILRRRYLSLQQDLEAFFSERWCPASWGKSKSAPPAFAMRCHLIT